MRVAVLGTGFGARHAELLAKRKEVESIILWGRKEEKLRELKEKLHVETTEDMEEIWSDGTIGLVDICLPNHLHREAAIKALRAGKHVFVETPVAESLADAEAIWKTAEQCGKRVFVDLFLRFEHPYEYLRQLVQGGRLGAPLKERETYFEYGIGVLLHQETTCAAEALLKTKEYRCWETGPCTYVVFRCMGENGDCIGETWERFYKEFLPQSGYESCAESDHEVYFDEKKDGVFCELWIPVKRCV